MVLAWIFEIAKTLAYALVTSLLFVFIRAILPHINTSKATGVAVLRAFGFPLMLVGFFTIVFGALLSRIDLVGGPGRIHFTLR
jgi:uncharacterized integral membrane protein